MIRAARGGDRAKVTAMKILRPLCHAALVVMTACGGRVLEHSNSDAAGSDGSGGTSATPPAEGSAARGGSSSSDDDPTTPPPPEPSGGRPSGHPPTAGASGRSTGGAAASSAGTSTGSGASTGTGSGGTGAADNTGTEVPVPEDYPDLDGRTHYVLAGLTNQGLVLAAYWTGSVEAVALLDPATGERSEIGTLNDLYLWTEQFIYDDQRRVAYALGENTAQAQYIYTFSLDDHTTTQTLLTDLTIANGTLGSVTSSGSIIEAAGDPTTLIELDPKTAATKPVGSIDGMTNWDGNFVYDEPAGTVYALGHESDVYDNYLFTAKLRTRSTSSILLAPSDTGAIYYTVGGLDPRGRLVAAYWDGEKEVLVTIDPNDASTNVVGSLGDLKNWDNQLVYNPTLGAVVALGWTSSNVAHLYETFINR